MLKILRNTIEKNIEPMSLLPEEKAYVRADPSQIEQVLLILCINGYHAMSIMRSENDALGGVLSIGVERMRPGGHTPSS